MDGNAFPLIFGTRNPLDRDCVIDPTPDTNPTTDNNPHPVSREEAAAYWHDTCKLKVSPPELRVPVRPRVGLIAGGPSRSTYPYLDIVRSFCEVPPEVFFCLPRDGERAEALPLGFFTMYEAQLLHSRLWFPIHALMVEILNLFNISISQVSPRSLQHLIGTLVLSYEQGLDLMADHLEGLLGTYAVSEGNLYCCEMRPFMEVIKGFSSVLHRWREYLFFVCLDGASVVEECLPAFKCMLGRRGFIVDYSYGSILVGCRSAFHFCSLQPYTYVSGRLVCC